MKDKEVEANGDVQIEDGQDQTDGNASFLRAARAGNLDKVLEYLKGSIDINTSNANGLNGLHLASKEGHVSVVTELLKRGANVDASTKKGNSALHIASLAGQEAIVKILVQHGASVNVQSQNGFTPLYMAAQENHDGVVRFLLANGANQSLATEDGFTPLAVALQQGHDKVVAVLLENDTRGKVRLPALHIASKKDDCKAAALLLQSDHNPDVTSKSGFTPLHIAAHYGNENIANLLLQRGADVNYPAKHNITPMHVASKWGKPNMITLLLDKNAIIDAKTRDGLTPLHCAARSGHDQVVDLMLERGAPLTAKTKNGLSPLHMAAQGDHVDSARILLYHKSPVDDVTVDYLTALHVAAHCGHVRVAKLLLDRKADPNARALNGFTPLHIACKKNRIKVVELLLKHGASIEATTESGLTPLHVASFMGCMNIVIYLIQHGSNPDVPTVRGETPLHLAARANQIDIIRILLRNGAHVDARAREQQTILHIAARLGNADIVALLLQHGASVDATTKDMYTALHIAGKDGQEDVASVLLEHGASLGATTKKGFTPLHLAAKYGNMKVAKLLLQRDAPVDAQGKNGVTPLHVAAHYDHQNVATMLLDKGASPHATAKNGYTPLHIAAKKNQMDIATTLLEYGAKANSESKAGFSPLHLAAQEGHTDMCTLLLEHHADPNTKAKNGLTPMHLCAQEDRVNVAAILAKSGAEIDTKTKAGYTPLHVACHFGQINMVRFLLQQGADVNTITAVGYTPLHQAAQQGHTLIINLLLENRASPNAVTNQGQTALSIAQRLGYISVVETLKVVTETIITTTTTTITEEKYRVVAPETMQETFMSDSEDDGGEDTMFGDQSYQYLTMDEMKSLGDDSMPTMDPTRDERIESHVFKDNLSAPPTAEEDQLSPMHAKYAQFTGNYAPDNIDISHSPVHAGKLKWKTFLVSFMVDARGGAMRGCRHSGVRVIIPPRKAPMPTRITCRYLKKEKINHPPPLMEGEACASRILEMGPAGAKFLGPVIIEVPHFASLRGKEREITILRSDNGESWREHTLEATEEAVQEVLNDSFDGEELNALEDLNTSRITRILTTDFPQYFAIVSRVRQEVHAIGPEGGMVSSTVVPQVQAVFPEGALTKKIKVGLQAQPIPAELVAKLLGNRVAVSPIVTVEPRRRKFHKPITLTIPVPQAAAKGMINTYSGDTPTLRLLCSITGGTTRAQWEDVTGSTPLTFVNDCVSFTTTVSARFWLMDCRNITEATKMATELYREAIHVPFMAKFVVFAKRHDPTEARLRVFCMTDDKEEKTLESQENFQEVAKSRDVEVLEAKAQFVEFAGNLVPVTKSGEQLSLHFHAFRENRLPFTTRVRDPHQDPVGRIAFMREPKVGRGEAPQAPICNLNITLPDIAKTDQSPIHGDLLTIEKRYDYLKEVGISKPETIHKAELRLSDISTLLGKDWVPLALQLDIADSDINVIKTEYPDDVDKQAIVMLRLWMQVSGNKATGNTLEKALRKINREDIVNHCIFNVELVTDDVERAVAKVHLDQSGFETLKEELGPSREASLRRDTSLDASYDEQDIMKAESAEETSSEAGSISEHPSAALGPDIIVSADRKARKAEEETEEDQEGASPMLPPRKSKKMVAFEQDLVVTKKTEDVTTVQKREKKVVEPQEIEEEPESTEKVCVPKRRSVTDIVSHFEVITEKVNGTATKPDIVHSEDVQEILRKFDTMSEKPVPKPRADTKPVVVTEIYKPLMVEEDTVVEETPEDIEDVEVMEVKPSVVDKVSIELDTMEDVVTRQVEVLRYEDISQGPLVTTQEEDLLAFLGDDAPAAVAQEIREKEPLVTMEDETLVSLLESDVHLIPQVVAKGSREEVVIQAQSHEISEEPWEDVQDDDHTGPLEAVAQIHDALLVCPVAAAHHPVEEFVGVLEPFGELETVVASESASSSPDETKMKKHLYELPLLQQQDSLSDLFVKDDARIEELITFGDYEQQAPADVLKKAEPDLLQEVSAKPGLLPAVEELVAIEEPLEQAEGEQHISTRTPPPSPVETTETQVQVTGVDGKKVTTVTTTKSESGDDGTTKKTVVTTTTVIGQNVTSGEPLEAARLAEAEFWASQELERITPDLLDSSRDSQGMISEEEPTVDGHVIREEWVEKDDSGNITRKVTKISYDSHQEFPDVHALPEERRAVGGPASGADMKGDASGKVGEQDDGVVEESIPFGKKKEFFENLMNNKEAIPRKTSPPSTTRQSPPAFESQEPILPSDILVTEKKDVPQKTYPPSTSQSPSSLESQELMLQSEVLITEKHDIDVIPLKTSPAVELQKPISSTKIVLTEKKHLEAVPLKSSLPTVELQEPTLPTKILVTEKKDIEVVPHKTSPSPVELQEPILPAKILVTEKQDIEVVPHKTSPSTVEFQQPTLPTKILVTGKQDIEVVPLKTSSSTVEFQQPTLPTKILVTGKQDIEVVPLKTSPSPVELREPILPSKTSATKEESKDVGSVEPFSPPTSLSPQAFESQEYLLTSKIQIVDREVREFVSDKTDSGDLLHSKIIEIDQVVQHPPQPLTRSLDLLSSDVQQETGDELCITTPDLETPKDGPEAAGKSDKQKMIEVTERVAEAASTLAWTLEKAEMHIPQVEYQDSGKWKEVEATVEDARRDAEILEFQLDREEEMILGRKVDHDERSIKDESMPSESEEGRAIKAEIKLLVKTTGEGKEAIEIRSIREFVDSGAGASATSTTTSSSLGRIFAEAASPTSSKSPPSTQPTSDQSSPHLASLSFAYEEPPKFGRALEDSWERRKMEDSAVAMPSAGFLLMEAALKASPTEESEEDHAVMDRVVRPPPSTSASAAVRAEVELAEVRTEDEAPEIEDDLMSPMTEQRPSGAEDSENNVAPQDTHDAKSPALGNMEFAAYEDVHSMYQQPEQESWDNGPAMGRTTSLDGISHERREKVSGDLQAQSSMEVEVGSRGSDEHMVSEEDRDRVTVDLEDIVEEEQGDRRHLASPLSSPLSAPDAMPMSPAMAEQRAVAQDTTDVEDVIVRPSTPPITSLPVVPAKPIPAIRTFPTPTQTSIPVLIPPRTTSPGGGMDSDQSVLTKPSPPETPTPLTEGEISPPVDYPAKLTPQNQVYVGVSPTEDPNLYGKEKPVSPQDSPAWIGSEGIPRTPSALLSSTSSSTMSFAADQTVSEVSDRSDTESTTQASSVVTVIHKPDITDTSVSSPVWSEAFTKNETLTTTTDGTVVASYRESRSGMGDSGYYRSTIESESSVYSTRTESTGSEIDDRGVRTSEELAFENEAFAGTEKIDVDEDEVPPRVMGATSPFEIPRSFEVTEEVDAQTIERRFRTEIVREELADSVDQPSVSFEQKKIEKSLPSDHEEFDELKKAEEHHLRLERHIRTEIFSTELDEAVIAPSPEIKGLIEETLGTTTEEEPEKFLAQRMRSDIFAGEMQHHLEDLSPEQKELPKFPEFQAFPESPKSERVDLSLGKLDIAMPDVVPSSDKSPVRSAKCEQVLWEVPVQEQGDGDATEVAVEIPPHKQILLEKEEEDEEDEERSDVMGEREAGEDADVETSEESTAPVVDRLSVSEARHIAEEMIEELKSEVARRPPLRQIPSEISEEDLIERFEGSPDIDDDHHVTSVITAARTAVAPLIPQLLRDDEEERFDDFGHAQPRLSSEDIRCKFIRIETSSVDITDEELRASDDELSPLEEHMERLQHMKVEENLRRDSFVKISEEHEASLLEREWEAAVRAQHGESMTEEASCTTRLPLTIKKTYSESKSEHESMEKSFSETSHYKTAETVRITTKPDGTKLFEEDVHKEEEVSTKDTVKTEKFKEESLETEESLKAGGREEQISRDVLIDRDLRQMSSEKVVEEASGITRPTSMIKEQTEIQDQHWKVLEHESSQEPLKHHEIITETYEKTEDVRIREGDLEDHSRAEERYTMFEGKFSSGSSQEASAAPGGEVSEEDRVRRRSSTTSSSAPDVPSDTERPIPVVVHRRDHRKDPHQVDARSSSGDSPYFSAETDSSSAHMLHGTPSTSRPCSSDVETLIMSAGVGSSEYETCATSQEETYGTAPTSQEYVSAGSGLSHSSRESMPSMDSESSGHMGSLEVSSETSETLVPSALEMMERDAETPTLLGSEEKFTFSSGTTTEQFLREPYDTDIPEHVIRGQSEPVGSPYLPDAGPSASSSFMLDSFCAVDSPSLSGHIFASAPREEDLDLEKYEDGDEEYSYECRDQREHSLSSPFEMISDFDLVGYEPGKEFIPEMVSECSRIYLEEDEDAEDFSDHRPRPTDQPNVERTTQGATTAPEQSLTQSGPLHPDDQSRSAVFRQESGAYMSGDRVDEFSDHPLSPEEGEKHVGGDPTCISSTDTSLTASMFSDRQSQATVLAAWEDNDGVRSFAQRSEDAADEEEEFGEKGTLPVHVVEVQGHRGTSTSPGSVIVPQDIYAQANGPVEVDFEPEYDAVEPGIGNMIYISSIDSPHVDGLSHPPDVIAETAAYIFRDEAHLQGSTGEVTCSSVETRTSQRFERFSSGDATEFGAAIVGPDSSDAVPSDEELTESDIEPDILPVMTPRAVSVEFGDKVESITVEVVVEAVDSDMLGLGISSGPSASALPPSRPVSRELSDAERTESELRDVDMSSRPLSHAESDSDQRPMSEFSDDRPDSELRDILRLASNHSEEKELEDIAERPLSPEPLDEYQISEEHVTSPPLPPPRIEGISLPRASSAVGTAGDQPVQREKHEYETSERSYDEKVTHTWSSTFPDITVTQHVSPTAETADQVPTYEDFVLPEDEDIEHQHVVPSAPEMEDTDSSSRAISPVVVQVSGTRVYPDEYDDAVSAKFDGADVLFEKGEFEDTEKDEGGKKEEQLAWESQLFQQPDETAAVSGYLYHMEFERDYEDREELYTHEEEDEEEDVEAVVKEVVEDKPEPDLTQKSDSNNTSTPDYDVLAGRRFFSKSGENDDASVSSLQEFERLELELSRRHSQGSQDSLNGKRPFSRTGQGDDASVSSLQEFEHLEHECVEAEKVEMIAQEEAARLSEIEEGHESQASEAESQETLSEQEPDDSDSDDYEQRMFEIDMIIKQAQCNVERFVEPDVDDRNCAKRHSRGTHTRSKQTTTASTSQSAGFTKKTDSGSGGSGGEATESSMVDKTPSAGEDSGDSLDDEGEQAKVEEIEEEDSLHEDRPHVVDDEDEDSLQEDAPIKGSANKDDCDTDSLRGDSAARRVAASLSGSIATDDRLLTGGGSGDLMASSTDSLEPSSSTATHATYQYETDSIMSSSFASMQTSGEESTMISSTDIFDVDHRVFPPGQQQHLEQAAGLPAGGAVVVEDNAQFRNGHAGFPTIPSRRFTDLEGNRLQKLLNDYVASTGGAQSGIEKEDEDVISEESTDKAPVIHRTVTMPPELSAVTFTGPDADAKMKEFMESFQPGEDIVEMETTDEMGNVHITRTVQRRVILQPQTTSDSQRFILDDNILSQQESQAAAEDEQEEQEEEIIEKDGGHGIVRRIVRRRRVTPPDVRTVSFSGPNAKEEMEEYMKKSIGGYQPGRHSEQTETRDEMGNVTRIVRHSVEVSEVSGDSGVPDSKAKVSVRTYYERPTSPAHAIFHTVPVAGSARVLTTSLVEGLSPSGSPKRIQSLPSSSHDSPPSSPTVSSSSHSEDCYCGPEADTETSAQVAFVGAQRTEDKTSWSSGAPDGQHADLMTEGHTMKDDHDASSESLDGPQEQDSHLRDDMQQILDHFMEEKKDHPTNHQDG